MNDRELLEAAAKAAGLKVRFFESYAPGLKVFGENRSWNPLADDGDALRLAVILRIKHERHMGQPFVAAWAPDVAGRFEEPEGADPYAATRRAIVRAAAAMAANDNGATR